MSVPLRFDLDLGDAHWLRYIDWDPDRELNPQYADLAPGPARIGAIVMHTRPDGSICEGMIYFDVPVARRHVPDETRWGVLSFEPLTLGPSLLCRCGDHGHIREGKWVRWP